MDGEGSAEDAFTLIMDTIVARIVEERQGLFFDYSSQKSSVPYL